MIPSLGLLSILALADSACPPPAAPVPIAYSGVRGLLAGVIAESFPELSRAQVLLYQLRSQSDFFVSGLDYGTMLKKGPTRTYIVYVNPRLFESPPSADAIRAVLAHELSHLVDYSRLSSPGIVKFVSRYLSRTPAHYERDTDLHAMERGYACGLAEYREWLYRRVSPKVRVTKETNYLTPEEIRAWVTSSTTKSRP